MAIKRGEIYWIKKNPYREAHGSCQTADRPGIIVSNNLNNEHSCTLEIVFLTTTPKKALPTHVEIESAAKPSIALCEQIHTISDEQIGAYIGEVTAEEMDAVNEALIISLDLTPYNPTVQAPAEPQLTSMETAYTEIKKELEIYRWLYNDLMEKILKRQ